MSAGTEPFHHLPDLSIPTPGGYGACLLPRHISGQLDAKRYPKAGATVDERDATLRSSAPSCAATVTESDASSEPPKGRSAAIEDVASV